MCQNLVQPLQGTVQVQLDPARGAGDSLPSAEQTHTLSGRTVLTPEFHSDTDRVSPSCAVCFTVDVVVYVL